MTTLFEPLTGLVTITDRAADKARELLVEKELPEGALRVFVVGGGCSGYQYGMALARKPRADIPPPRRPEADDTETEAAEGVRILVDPESVPLIRGAEVDYVDELMKSGFTIYNPNAAASCACGSSFQASHDQPQGTPRACT